MQTLEQNGYTRQQVIDQLSFKSGSRQMAFRYELLDNNNVFKKNLTNVTGATITNTYLADIKRTAHFDLLEDGTINFYSDRIKPYCRLTMPSAGRSSSANNYVEWPQGVFLLSSPTMVNDSNQVVTRSVDAYDQNQVYADDLVTDRFTAGIGRKYIDVVTSLIMNEFVSPGLNDPVFTKTNAVATSKTAGTITGPIVSSSNNNFATPYNYSMSGLDTSVNMTMPATGAGHRFASLRVWVDASNYAFTFWTGIATPTLTFRSCINGTISDTIVTYSAVTHKFWRIFEAKGLISWQTSPDGVTWTTQKTLVIPWTYQQGVSNQLALISTGVEASWSVPVASFSLVASTLRQANISPSTAVLRASKDYPPGTSRLAIINDLLGQINYESMSFDENGFVVVKPYLTPDKRPVGFTYKDDTASVLLPAMTRTIDLFSVPNQWTLVVSNPDQTTLKSTYTNTNPASPTSTVSRGRTIGVFITEQDSPDQATLDARAENQATLASQIYEQGDFTTALMPFHGTNDVLQLNCQSCSISDRYDETQWVLDMKDGGLMKHVVRRVSSV